MKTFKQLLRVVFVIGAFLVTTSHTLAATPSATNLSAAETYTEDIPKNLTDIVASDADGDPLTATLTLSNPAVGSFNTATSGAVTSTYIAGTGVWTASGAIADVNTLLAGLIFTPAANYNSSFTIATSVSDGAASASGTKTVTGVAVNDAPSATNLSAAESYTEDGSSVNLIDIVASDVDGGSITVTLTLNNTSAGSLSTATSGAVTSTFSLGVWTASGAIADVNTLLAGVTFTPAANFDSNFTIATNVSDGAASASGTKAVTATAVNDAPVLDATKSPALGSIPEGSGAPSGTVGSLVSSLVDFASPSGQVDNITDPDSGAVLGIAITATDTTDFTWYYSLNGGATWNTMGAVSGASSRLLASDADNRIYGNPGSATAGTYSDMITFRAWDQTSGTDGSLTSTTSSGGSTAFSTATDTVGITVTSNHAPVAVDDTETVDENSIGLSLNVLGNDTDADDDSLTITAVGTPDNGGDAQIILGGAYIGYTPATDFSGTETFTYTVSDGTDTDTGTVTITINPIPEVASVSPENNATEQPINPSIVINFSEAMNTASITVSPNDTYTQGWSNGNQTLTLTKSGGLQYGTPYSITVNGESSLGVPMASSYTWSFTTERAPVSTGGGGSWTPKPQTTVIAPEKDYHFPRLLKRGMKGDDVVVLQNFLQITSIPSKLFGPGTQKAVATYQKAHNLKADGIAGPKTLKMIEGAINK